MAEKSANIIELNGKRYDAHTGRLIAVPSEVQQANHKITAATPKKPATPVRHNRALDNIAPNKKEAAKKNIVRAPAAHVARHKAQKPHTLMRRSVPKPQTSNKLTLKVQAPAAPTTNIPSVQPKLSMSGINPKRALNAAQTPKSPAVNRFNKPTVFAPKITKPQIASSSESQKTAQADSKKAFFEKAIANATSHQQQAATPKKSNRLKNSLRRQKSVFMVAASASVLVIVGAFIAFSNMSTLEVKIASMRAGVSVNLPGYQPAGYTKNGPVAYQSGKVTVGFKANDSSGRQYKVSQEESNWNSETLYDSVVASNKNVQKVEQNGNTVYIYDGSNASWVSGGILHTITGNANLSSEQLLKIASSV